MTKNEYSELASMLKAREQDVDLEPLERMVDRHGLGGVLHMLSRIADEKAEHLAVNWQDAHSAKRWAMDADYLERIANHVERS